MRPNNHRLARDVSGFSLVELLVVIVISLLASLAVFGVLSTYEAKKRTTTFVNDMVQSGNFAMFYIDKLVRESGSGFSQNWATAYGCQLYGFNSAAGTTTIFPTASLPAPFTQIQTDTGGKFVLAPVLIDSTATVGVSDSLIVMSGNSGNGEYPVSFTAVSSAATTLPLTNTIAFSSGDLVLLTDTAGTTQSPCMLTQVNSTYVAGTNSIPPAPLPLAGTYYKASFGTGTAPQVVNYSKIAQALDLGNPTSDSPPTFELLGVNSSNVFVDYPLLTSPAAPQQVADGVIEMHALYGLDETGTGTITNWVAPTGTFALSNLITQSPGAAGTPGSGAYLIQRIKAIRIGLIMRTDLPEQNKKTLTNAAGTNASGAVSSGTVSLFTDLPGLTYTNSTLSTAYRYRTVEETIPVRNNLLIVK